MTSSYPSLLRQVRRWVPALLLVAVGVVIGWLIIAGVLALPLPKGALFGLGGLCAAAFLGGAVWFRQLAVRAFAIGGFVGTAGSLVLVALLVIG